MKTVKDKYLVVGADFAGFPLKEVVVPLRTGCCRSVRIRDVSESLHRELSPHIFKGSLAYDQGQKLRRKPAGWQHLRP